MSTRYEAVIGLEVHAELLTRTKIFCGCPAHFGGEVNTHVCPVCLGMPGSLPVLNRQVVELAIRAGLALNCTVAERCKFDRKNYYYPDLPKGYQITQYDQPIGEHGWLEIGGDGGEKRIRITRLHMEEDAGKLNHVGSAQLAGATHSLVDLNRAGVPLIEIVGEPDIRSAEEARAYVQELRNILVTAGVCDGKMEQGSLRCDANVSLRAVGSTKFGQRTETKNLNSFRSIQRAIEYEIARQAEVLDAGGTVVQETRLWDENKGQTFGMRSKEEAHDYRYFPEPDLVPLVVDRTWIDRVLAELPEMPSARRKRYVEQLGLSPYDAGVLVDDLEMAQFFDQTVAIAGDARAKAVANWLMGNVTAYLNEQKVGWGDLSTTPAQLAELVQLVEAGTIGSNIAKTVIVEMLATGKEPAAIVQEKGLSQISDEGAIAETIRQVIAECPSQVADYKAGKTKVMGFLVGQAMKKTQGRAKPDVVNRLMAEELAKV